MDDVGFRGLVAVLQYREIGRNSWLNMAAFDSVTAAERYRDICANSAVWQYRVIDIVSPVRIVKDTRP